MVASDFRRHRYLDFVRTTHLWKSVQNFDVLTGLDNLNRRVSAYYLQYFGNQLTLI